MHRGQTFVSLLCVRPETLVTISLLSKMAAPEVEFLTHFSTMFDKVSLESTTAGERKKFNISLQLQW